MIHLRRRHESFAPLYTPLCLVKELAQVGLVKLFGNGYAVTQRIAIERPQDLLHGPFHLRGIGSVLSTCILNDQQQALAERARAHLLNRPSRLRPLMCLRRCVPVTSHTRPATASSALSMRSSVA